MIFGMYMYGVSILFFFYMYIVLLLNPQWYWAVNVLQMPSTSLIVLLAVIVCGNIAASTNSKQTKDTPEVQEMGKCEGRQDRPECPVHIENGFCSREGITEEQKWTYCPVGCGLCNKTKRLH
nr:Hypothetical protein CBG08333 [Haemonchus contortus]